MIFYLLKTITAISILFYLFISIRAMIIGLIHQDATLLDRGLKIFAFAFLIIISSIAILLFIPTSISTILTFFYFVHNSIVIVYKRNKVLNL